MQHVPRCWERQSDGSEYKETLRRPGLRPGPRWGSLQNPLVGGDGLAVPSPGTPSPALGPSGLATSTPQSKISSDAIAQHDSPSYGLEIFLYCSLQRWGNADRDWDYNSRFEPFQLFDLRRRFHWCFCHKSVLKSGTALSIPRFGIWFENIAFRRFQISKKNGIWDLTARFKSWLKRFKIRVGNLIWGLPITDSLPVSRGPLWLFVWSAMEADLEFIHVSSVQWICHKNTSDDFSVY